MTFVVKILKQWIIYLGFIPTIYDFSSAYFKYDFDLPQFIIIGFPLVVFLYATYQIYKDEHIKALDLQKKIEGPTNYEVKAILNAVNFHKDELLQHLDSLKVEAEKRLGEIPSPLETSNIEQLRIALLTESLYDKSSITYNNELLIYEQNLTNILQNIDSIKVELANQIDEYETKFFFINFFIKNIGITSDTDIHIEIECLNENILFRKEQMGEYGVNLDKLIPSLPKIPSKPSRKSLSYSLDHSLFSNPLYNIPNIQNIPNHQAFRKKLEINEKQCSVTIRDLHVGDNVNLFEEEIILLLNDDTVSFNATIKSKESTKVLTPFVQVEKKHDTKQLFDGEK